MDEDARPRPASLPNWRIASRNGKPSISPTVPADLAQHEVDIVGIGDDQLLDGVGDMGNHLYRAAEKIAPALARDQALIQAPGSDAVAAPRTARR